MNTVKLYDTPYLQIFLKVTMLADRGEMLCPKTLRGLSITRRRGRLNTPYSHEGSLNSSSLEGSIYSFFSETASELTMGKRSNSDSDYIITHSDITRTPSKNSESEFIVTRSDIGPPTNSSGLPSYASRTNSNNGSNGNSETGSVSQESSR